MHQRDVCYVQRAGSACWCQLHPATASTSRIWHACTRSTCRACMKCQEPGRVRRSYPTSLGFNERHSPAVGAHSDASGGSDFGDPLPGAGLSRPSRLQGRHSVPCSRRRVEAQGHAHVSHAWEVHLSLGGAGGGCWTVGFHGQRGCCWTCDCGGDNPPCVILLQHCHPAPNSYNCTRRHPSSALSALPATPSHPHQAPLSALPATPSRLWPPPSSTRPRRGSTQKPASPCAGPVPPPQQRCPPQPPPPGAVQGFAGGTQGHGVLHPSWPPSEAQAWQGNGRGRALRWQYGSRLHC